MEDITEVYNYIHVYIRVQPVILDHFKDYSLHTHIQHAVVEH